MSRTMFSNNSAVVMEISPLSPDINLDISSRIFSAIEQADFIP